MSYDILMAFVWYYAAGLITMLLFYGQHSHWQKPVGEVPPIDLLLIFVICLGWPVLPLVNFWLGYRQQQRLHFYGGE